MHALLAAGKDDAIGAVIAVSVVTFIVLLIVGAKALEDNKTKKWLVHKKLKSLLGSDYRQFSSVNRSFSPLNLPNVRRAVEAYVNEQHGELETISCQNYYELQAKEMVYQAPLYRQMDIDVDRHEDCLVNPIYLIKTPTARIAIRLGGVQAHGAVSPVLQAISTPQDVASGCLGRVCDLMQELSIYRGRVISVERQRTQYDYDDAGTAGLAQVRFHKLPPVAGDAIVLPAATMRIIERNTISFFKHADRLRREGHPVKRGLLFHGKPGTGKTRTACWLTHSMPNVTVFLVTGEQLWNIKECCDLARSLAPAMLILEDVDLIATRRDQNFQTTALHQLMNEMDGLDSSADILFLLTTNLPDQIEAALANRPGRIDQAIHFPLPDEDCRRRLFELYACKSKLQVTDWSAILKKTHGSSPAFIKELVRKAALISVEATTDDAPAIELHDQHFLEALSEMTSENGELTRRITGFAMS